jgi:hypothetical protein
MKRMIVLLFQFILVTANAQTGDFELENLPQRTYVKISANPDLKGNGFKRWLIGENYRKEWTDSIRVPVLDFKNDFGGLTPEKEGGGKQTHSLHIKDGRGGKWVLRSVEKFPEKVIAPELKGTIGESLVHDGISASYPYSVLSVGTLAKAAGIPYFQNTVVYIPDDPALGEFRSTYGNTLSLLESKTFANKETHDTEDIFPELYNNKKFIDQKAVLRARLLDNFIMDFDRHEGQWEWIEKDSAGRIYYYPVPKDRDQAFFKADGLIPKKLSRKSTLGQLQGLSAKFRNVHTFNYAARNFDRVFLTELDEATWNNEIDTFLSSMTDDAITRALSKQPEEIQKYHSPNIATTLKEKRSFFKNDMLQYYRLLSRTVSVVGNNSAEVFTIAKNADGSVLVTVRDKEDSAITYNRLLDTATKELRIYGLEGDDHFLITGESSPIKIRLIGGPGEDVFTHSAQGKKVLVYDVSFENNLLEGKFKNKISKDPLNNEYQRVNPIYNSSSLGPTAEYARDGGLFLGLRYTATTTGFRKEPYASKHMFSVTKALSSSAWHLHYDADFMKVGRNTDLLFRSDAKLPTVRTHFFGYGNNTFFDKNKKADYYLIQYPLVDASLMLRHSLSSWLQIQYGPSLQYFNISESKNRDRYLNGSPPHEITSSTYGSKFFGGAEGRMIINTRNNEVIPTRGLYVNAFTRSIMKLSGKSKEFNQSGGNLSFYTDFLFKNHIIIASSFGFNHNFGRFEVPQAQYLGLRQNLRGYKYQRFAGRTRAYNNSDLRISFGDVNFYLFKGPLGIIGFHDIGRVWADGESSDTWHKGYGGGIWLAPFNKVVVSGLLTFSEEERALPFVTFGFFF